MDSTSPTESRASMAHSCNNVTEERAIKTRRTSAATSPTSATNLSAKDTLYDKGPTTPGVDMPASELSTSPSSESSIRSKPAHLDIANFPTADLLRMLAALLQHIATSNDQIRPLNQQSMEERVHHPRDPNAIPSSMYLPLNDPQRPTTTTAALATLNSPSSTLCFHARHIPSISIEAYLLRILKYCPTTNDVFLSLLVYFDRLSRVGAVGNFPGEPPLGTYADEDSSTKSLRDSSTSPISMPWPRADVESDISKSSPDNNFPGISGFAIDSYNVHRLIIAGITVASKFFSDVFYTNARYAKVGGLAVHELNQLELHFLLLTDFRLMIPISEIQQYGDQLLAYAHDRSFSSNIQRPLPGSTEEKTQHEVHE